MIALDAPTAGLDTREFVLLTGALEKLLKDDKTVIIISHVMHFIAELVPRVIYVDTMQLYFTCPTQKETFASDDYSLHPGHSIVQDDKGAKELQGTVSLNTACPLCGQKHQYAVKDVLCPLTQGNNER